MNARRRAAAAVLAWLTAAVLVLAGCTGKDAVDQSGGNFRFVSGTARGSVITPGDRKSAADFDGSLLGGGTYRSAANKGKVVVVNFWATWCGPCTVETPQFDLVYRAYKSKGVAFVGIDTKEAGRDQPRAFVRDHHISYPIVFDEQGETAVRLGNLPAQALPFTVLIDKQGRVAAVYQVALSPKDIEPVINELLAEKA